MRLRETFWLPWTQNWWKCDAAAAKGYAAEPAAPRCSRKKKKGSTRVNFERSEEALSTGAGIIAAACPFCNTMLTDGVKHEEKEDTVEVMDIAELIAASID